MLAPMKEPDGGPKFRKMIWNDDLDIYFKYSKFMVSSEILMDYPYQTITFILHTDDYDKQLGYVIIQDKKHPPSSSGNLSRCIINALVIISNVLS